MEVWIIVILAGLAVLGFWINSVDANTKRKQTDGFSSVPGFSPKFVHTAGIDGMAIALDPSTRRVAIGNGSSPPKLFKFSELVSIEILKNGSSITRTNRGSQAAGAIMGAVLLGPLGLLLGGVTGAKRQEEKVDKLTLRLHVSDFDQPFYDVPFFNGPRSKSTSPLVVQASQKIDEWHSRLKAVLSDNQP